MEKKIIIKYTNLINEYFSSVSQSNLLKTTKNHTFLTYIGLNSILYIFKILLNTTNNVEKAFLDSQKGYYYYLEYIEQIKNSNVLHNLNNIDAIKFIYNKALNPENQKEEQPTQTPKINMIEYKNQEKKVNVLLNWENLEFTLENRIDISKKYLLNYLLIDNSFHYLFDYLEIIIEKTNMNFEKYFEFLGEFYKQVLKLIKQKKIPTKSEMEDIWLNNFYVNKDSTLYEKNTRLFVKTLLQGIHVDCLFS